MEVILTSLNNSPPTFSGETCNLFTAPQLCPISWLEALNVCNVLWLGIPVGFNFLYSRQPREPPIQTKRNIAKGYLYGLAWGIPSNKLRTMTPMSELQEYLTFLEGICQTPSVGLP